MGREATTPTTMAATAGQDDKKVLVPHKMRRAVLQVRYEVRGIVATKATEYEAQMRAARSAGLPSPFVFDRVVYCNIGNPQQLGQQPITYVRQVSALIDCPELLASGAAQTLFPADAIAHAKRLLASGLHSGAYTHSQGCLEVRRDVAAFITRRDGEGAPPCSPDSVFITDGASTGVKVILNTIIEDSDSGRSVGVLIPIPQYPLYSASLSLFCGNAVPYYLDEEHGWSLDVAELKRAYDEAVGRGIDVRALVVINPNNPTGTVLPLDAMRDVVRFCAERGVLLMADEVYQENLYEDGAVFTSFRKIAYELYGDDTEAKLELVSFHSASKGFLGECGKRSGYFQLEGVQPAARAELLKLATVNLCPNTAGQIVLDVMVAPPQPGSPSHEQFVAERAEVLASLKRRAQSLSLALNKLEGVRCSPPTAAMYLFPSITLPEKAIDAAEKEGLAADTFYCLELLQETGVVVVPGSGFGQRAGTYHFRIAFLPPEDQISAVAGRLGSFHAKFMDRYK